MIAQQLRRRRDSGMSNRLGITIAETLVALIVLGASVSVLGRFVATVDRGLSDRELSSRIGWELRNARETVGSWKAETISKQRIEQLAISESLKKQFSSAAWEADVESIEQPVEATQITLTFVCNYKGQQARPATLTFWVPTSSSTNASGAPSRDESP